MAEVLSPATRSGEMDVAQVAMHRERGVIDAGAGIGGVGNEGVASHVQRTRMSIGYVEFAYAKRHALTSVALRNRDGAFVAPDRQAFEAAASAARWGDTAELLRSIANPPGAACWPLTAPSFIVVRERPQDVARTRELLAFFDWALTQGSGGRDRARLRAAS